MAVWDAGGSGSGCLFHRQCSQSPGEMWEESDIPSQQEEEENKYVRTDGRTVNLQHKLELESQRV